MSATTTPEQPPHPSGVLNVRAWELWAKPRGAALFLLIVNLAAAAGTIIACFAVDSLVRTNVVMTGVIIALGLIAAEMSIRVERMRRWFSNTPQSPHVNFSSVWTLAAAMVLPASLAAVVVLALYGHLWLRIWRRQSHVQAYRVAFNISNVLLCCYVAGWFVRWSLPTISELSNGLSELVGIAATVAVYFAVNSVLAAVAIALLQADRSLQRLLGDISDNVLELATLCLGAVTATLLVSRPWLVPLVFLPMYALHRGNVLTRGYEIAATTDDRTGLLNLTNWSLYAEKELERSRHQQAECGVLLINLDHLRRINDIHGRKVGDQALRAVATKLKDTTRSYDLCGRFKAEEFVVLLPKVGAEAALRIATRICDEVRALVVDTEEDVQRLSVSIGVASFPANGSGLEELLLAAGLALFAAKDGGRDRARAAMATS
jgi:diguanylate cyclase (GGDEF)-like protein